MARQQGPLFITGTIGDLVFYKLGENYYVRQKGDPAPGTKKRMQQDKGYALLQLRQSEFGQASKLVETMYYTLPREVRKHGLFGKLTGKAVRWLRQGKREEEVLKLLIAHCQALVPIAIGTPAATPTVSNTPKATPVTTPAQHPPDNSKPRTTKVKQARYLSRWKVKPNGRLHVPKSRTAACISAVIPLPFVILNPAENLRE